MAARPRRAGHTRRRGAKLVAINNPNNPTGSLMDEAFLREVVAICERAGAWLLCDEVYRGIDQSEPGTTVSVADLYERGISTGSMSKAFSMAGVRLGWVVAARGLIEADDPPGLRRSAWAGSTTSSPAWRWSTPTRS